MKKVLFILSCTLVLSSCGDGKKQAEPEVVTVDVNAKEVYTAADTKASFDDPNATALFQHYIDLKTALVNTDATTTKAIAAKMVTASDSLTGMESLNAAAAAIAATDDVEAQRVQFVPLTEGIELMVDKHLASGTIYKQYCPMAFDFEGGFWLSNSKEIYNPYFGDKMLHCGKVDSKIE